MNKTIIAIAMAALSTGAMACHDCSPTYVSGGVGAGVSVKDATATGAVSLGNGAATSSAFQANTASANAGLIMYEGRSSVGAAGYANTATTSASLTDADSIGSAASGALAGGMSTAGSGFGAQGGVSTWWPMGHAGFNMEGTSVSGALTGAASGSIGGHSTGPSGAVAMNANGVFGGAGASLADCFQQPKVDVKVGDVKYNESFVASEGLAGAAAGGLNSFEGSAWGFQGSKWGSTNLPR